MLCYAILYYTMRYYTILYDTLLYYAPCPQVLGRVGGGELVRVEDEGRVEPRDDGDLNIN